MLIKKGFTLAEVLIVLTVIGVIAALGIANVTKGLKQSQIKAGYHKALKTVSDVMLMVETSDDLPATNISAETVKLFKKMNKDISVVGYVSKNVSPVNSGIVVRPSDYKTSIVIDGETFGTGNAIDTEETIYSITTFGSSHWIVTEDNMAYSVMCGGQTSVPAPCVKKGRITNQATQKDAVITSCALVIVDVNGLSKGPNKFDPQAGPATGQRVNQFDAPVTDGVELQPLQGDQYLIFVGSNGATAGPKKTTVTGRILAGLR